MEGKKRSILQIKNYKLFLKESVFCDQFVTSPLYNGNRKGIRGGFFTGGGPPARYSALYRSQEKWKNRKKHLVFVKNKTFLCISWNEKVRFKYPQKGEEFMLKKAARKILSLVLAAGVVFSGGISNLYASAKDGTPKDNSSQIRNEYAVMDKEGNFIRLAEDPTESAADGKVQVAKTITPTDTENVFDINLKVVTTEEVKEIKISPDAAVVLVMDVSNSMKWDVDGDDPGRGEKSRITLAKDAAQKFIDGYTENAEDAKRMVSIVQFGSNAQTVLGWTDAANAQGKSQVKNAIQNNVQVNFEYKSGKHRESDAGGTNIEGGLMLARNLLDSSAIADIDNVYVIMLSDGVPTYYVADKDESTRETSFITGSVDDGFNSGSTAEWNDYKDINGAERDVGWPPFGYTEKGDNIAQDIHDKTTALYTISFATSKDKNTVDGKTVKEWLSSFATQNFDATNVEALELTFENIAQIIQNGAKAWIVHDPMGENIIFDTTSSGIGVNNPNAVANYDTASDTLTWNIKQAIATSSSSNGVTTYTYSLSYRIVLDTTTADFQEGEWYLTNGRTYLTYMLTENGEIDPNLYEVNFRVPYVQGFLGDFSFVKADADYQSHLLSGAEFTLEGTATGSGKSVSMKAESQAGGSVSFSNIPAGVYTLKETAAPEGYELSEKTYKVTVSYGNVTVEGMEKNSSQQYVVPNEPSKVDISVKKVWEGVDKDDPLPNSVTVTLTRNGQETDKTLTLNAGNNWQGTFTGLREYDENGKKYIYGISESPVNGYTVAVTGDAQKGFTVTNTYDPGAEGNSVDISGTKTWVDPVGTEHPAITINLLQDGTPIKSVTLENGETSYSFTDLPKYGTDGHVYVYTVEEEPVDGYSSKQDGNNFINTINQEKIAVSGTKTWIAPEGTVHPDITIVLNRDGEEFDRVTLKNGETFYSFKDLDKYAADGHEYVYTVAEQLVDGYTSEQNGNNFTNTIQQDNTVAVSGTKTWIDPVGTVHPDVTIVLNQDGEEYKRVTLKNGETTYSFTNLPKYDLNDGHVYEYTVEELPVKGYTSKQDGTNFTNTIQQDNTVAVSGTKTWIDPVGTVHPDVTIVLNQDGEEYKRVTLKNGETTYSFTDLPKYDLNDGHVYEYTVEELPVKGYTSKQDGTNFINTIQQDNTVAVSGTKTWIAPEGTVHPTITIDLLRDGTVVDSKELVNGETTYSFANLPKYDLSDGHVYVYTVAERPVDGYTSEQNGNNFTNTINQEIITVSGTKTWVDPEGTVHPTITINLLRDGEVIDSVELADGETSYSFENLDKYDLTDGHVYEYAVSEEPVEGYTSQVNGYDIINTVEQAYFDINGMKTWENVPDGETLPEITIILYKNGEEVGRTTASEDTYWEYSFQNLEQYDLTTGQENVYTVAEVPVEGYETEITGYDIVNTYVTEEIPDEPTPETPPEEIPDDDTPLTPPGDGTEEIPDDDTPLGPPTTGEAENLLPVALAAVSVTGLFVLTIVRRKTVKE